MAAARARLEQEGAEELSLRGVARDLGVTAPALYAHVRDKDELLALVATEHFEALVERFHAVDVADPLDRIRALAEAYVDHAVASPALFGLLFRYPPAPMAVETSAFPPATRAFEAAAAATRAAVASGALDVTDPALASLVMWASVHGVAEVALLGLGGDQEGRHALLVAVVDTVLRGQGARIGPVP